MASGRPDFSAARLPGLDVPPHDIPSDGIVVAGRAVVKASVMSRPWTGPGD
jgi:hypothetical protein